MWKGTGFIIALGFLCFVVWAHGAQIPDGGIEPDCDQYHLPACSRNYEPVCGTDGETYPNECILCFYNSERHLNVRIKQRTRC